MDAGSPTSQTCPVDLRCMSSGFPNWAIPTHSTGGGRLPVWSRDGRELFFSSYDNRQMLTVPVQSATTLAAGRSQVLFEFAMVIRRQSAVRHRP